MRQLLIKPGVMAATLTTLILLLVGGGALLLVGSATQANGRPAAPAAGPAAQALTTTAVPEAPPATITATATPTDPFSVLFVFNMLPPGGVLVKDSVAKLGSGVISDVVMTVDVTNVITDAGGTARRSTVASLTVLRYDPAGNTWKVQWQTPAPNAPGRASALPDTFPDTTRRYQAGDLLRTGQPILLLRTYDAPKNPGDLPAIHLRLWAWTGDTAVPLRLTGPSGADQEADFVGSSDVQIADLDDDGVIEVLVDSGAQTTVYHWAKDRFVVRP